MKRSKKILIIVATIALFVALGFVFYINIMNAPRLTVMTPSGAVKPGEEFNVYVVLENNPGIVIFCLWLAYDDTRFDFVSASAGHVLEGQSLDTKDVIFEGSKCVRVTNGLRTDAFKTDGIMYAVTFRVKDSADSGKSTFSLKYRKNDIGGEPIQPGNKANNFTPATVDGKVSIWY